MRGGNNFFLSGSSSSEEFYIFHGAIEDEERKEEHRERREGLTDCSVDWSSLHHLAQAFHGRTSLLGGAEAREPHMGAYSIRRRKDVLPRTDGLMP